MPEETEPRWKHGMEVLKMPKCNCVFTIPCPEHVLLWMEFRKEMARKAFERSWMLEELNA